MKNLLKGTSSLSAILVMMTSMVITLFFFGKIVEISHGIHKGGIAGSIGVGIIIMANIIIVFSVKKIEESQKK
jgi:hypothetical protein